MLQRCATLSSNASTASQHAGHYARRPSPCPLTLPDDRACCSVATTSSWCATSEMVRGRLQRRMEAAAVGCSSGKRRRRRVGWRRVGRSGGKPPARPTHYFSVHGCAMAAAGRPQAPPSATGRENSRAGCAGRCHAGWIGSTKVIARCWMQNGLLGAGARLLSWAVHAGELAGPHGRRHALCVTVAYSSSGGGS